MVRRASHATYGPGDGRQDGTGPHPTSPPDLVAQIASRRSRAACSLCRYRKVRCDIERKRPCSNCVFENVDCVIPQRKERKKARPRRPYPGPAPVDSEQSVTQPVESPKTDKQHQTVVVSPQDLRHVGFEASDCSQMDVDHGGPRDNNYDVASDSVPSQFRGEQGFDWYAAATRSVPSATSPEGFVGLSASGLSYSEAERSAQKQKLPSWLKPVPPHLPAEDLDYLRRKGALLVPEPELRDDLLKNYINFVHPCLPVLDLAALQASMQDSARHGKMSLLLFQAVMFAGAAWANIKLVRRSGYFTRMAMRRAFYTKTKVLYDLSYEQDRLAIVQALTILTIWWDGPSEQKEGYYYCSLALSVAKSIGLHKEVHNQNLPPPLKRLRRRLWWTCLMRDTITSIGGNRAPRTKDSDFTVPELTLEDFDIREPASQGAADQRQLAYVCISQSKLCRIISRILELAYDENAIGHTGVLYPRQDSDTIPDSESDKQPRPNLVLQELEICDKALKKWREEASEDHLHQSPSPAVDLPHEQAPLVHRAILSMLYFVAIFSLHRPRVLAAHGPNPPSSQSPTPQTMMRYAATCTNKIVMELYQADLMRCLPATGMCCILATSFSHIIDLHSGEDRIRREAMRRLEECKQALRELADTHAAADWAVKFLNFAAAHVTRVRDSRRRMQQNFTESARGDNEQHLSNQPSAPGPSSEAAQIMASPGDELIAFDASAPVDRDFQHWQPPTETLVADNYGLPPEDSLLPDENLDLSNFQEMWMGGLDSFNMAGLNGTFDGGFWASSETL